MSHIPYSTCQINTPVKEQVIEIGTFNIEWFPCKDDGKMLMQYGINLRYPPTGGSTDMEALFGLLKKLDIELLGVEEIVDPQMFADSAKKYLGEQFKFIYSPSGGDQKIGFLYDSNVLQTIGKPKTYMQVALSDDSRLRPALALYFKAIPSGFDFHAIVVHLKASPRGWELRKKQWSILEQILTELPRETGDGDVILMGDFNNVSKLNTAEFDSIMQRTNFYRATLELGEGFSDYWQPDYKKERIEGSLIDQIFISKDAKIEFIENSTKVGGMCAEGSFEYIGDSIPDYYQKISDHCPVYSSFKVDMDND
jgi:endonuclease/exonuclease/phosphatase family metal-dependent hydrolase